MVFIVTYVLFQGFFERAAVAKSQPAIANLAAPSMLEATTDDVEEGWGDDDEEEVEEKKTAEVSADSETGWDVEDADLEIPDVGPPPGQTTETYVHLPTRGPTPAVNWTKNSSLAIDHVLAGSFESACRLLHDQVGIVNFKPYETLFLNIYSASRTIYTWQQHIPAKFNYPQRNYKENPAKGLPVTPIKLTNLITQLQLCYQLTTGGKFAEVVSKLQALILEITLLSVDTKMEVSEAQQLLKICREYILGLKMDTLRKSLPKTTPEEQKRQCEMAAYFTHCNLQPVHQILTLRTALNMFFKLKNYKTATSFAKRLLELGPRPEVAQQARKILQACDTNPIDELTLQYDEHNPFSICGYSYTPIYRGKSEEKCPLCGASYLPEYKGLICNVCEVAEIGLDGVDLRISALQFK